MKLWEIEKEYLNGDTFHDSRLVKVELDYTKNECIFNLEYIFDIDNSTYEPSYRPITLKFSQLKFFIIEPPDPNNSISVNTQKGLWIGGISELNTTSLDDSKTALIKNIKKLSEDSIALRVYVNEYNSFIYLASGDIEVV